jgi:hypothetical protein
MKESILGASKFKFKCPGLLDEVAKSLRGGWKVIVKIKGDIVKFNEAGVWENG